MKPMDDSSSSTIDQTDEDILSDTVSDEALEAAAGTTQVGPSMFTVGASTWSNCCTCSGERS
jgi:hypothetical protein